MLKQYLPFLQKDRPVERNRQHLSEPQSLDCTPRAGGVSPPVSSRVRRTTLATPHALNRGAYAPRSCAVLCALILAVILTQATVMAQSNNITNVRSGHGNTSSGNLATGGPFTGTYYTTYSGGVIGSDGSVHDPSGLWWGLSSDNNVLVHLQNQANALAAGGTGNVTVLDLDTSSYLHRWVTGYSAGSNTLGGYNGNPGTWNTHFWGAENDRSAFESTQSGIVDISGTKVLSLRVDANYLSRTGEVTSTYGTTTTNTSINFSRFQITGTTIKDGTGTLSLEINNLLMTTFIGDLGTLQIANNTTGTGALTTGTLDSQTVTLNGGNGTIGQTTNIGQAGFGQNSSSTFNVHSVNDATNWWHIGTLNGRGFNSTGYMYVSSSYNDGTGNASLRATTNIGGSSNGLLDIAGTTVVGDANGTHVLNVKNNGSFESHGRFSAGTVDGSVTYINDVWGGVFQTDAGTALGTQTTGTSTVVENISDSSRSGTARARTNSGAAVATDANYGVANYIVGQTNGSNATLNIFTGRDGVAGAAGGTGGLLNTTGGNMVFGYNTGSTGIGNVFGSGSVLNINGNNDLIVGRQGSGTLNVYNSAVVNVTDQMVVGEYSGGPGVVKVNSGGKVNVNTTGNTASLPLVPGVNRPSVGNGYPKSDGTYDPYKHGYRALIIGDQAGATGTFTVSDVGSHLQVTGDVYVADQANTRGTLEVLNGATTNIDGNVYVGVVAGSEGWIRVDGVNANTSSYLSIHGDVFLGIYGKGNMIASNYGIIEIFGQLVESEDNANVHAFNNGEIWIHADKTIADKDSFGHSYIDLNSSMTVIGRLIVGDRGWAGGVYEDNRYHEHRFGSLNFKASNPGYEPDRLDTLTTGDPAIWADALEHHEDFRDAITDAMSSARTDFAKFNPFSGSDTGNAPGLAITRSSIVSSIDGTVGNKAPSIGYVVIDDKDPTAQGGRSTWLVGEYEKVGKNFVKDNDGNYIYKSDGELVVGDEGIGIIRVLNGALLQSGSATIGKSQYDVNAPGHSDPYAGYDFGFDYSGGGTGTVYVVGNGAVKGTGSIYQYTYIDEDGELVTLVGHDKDGYQLDDNNEGKYIPNLPHGERSEWINLGPMTVGEQKNSRGLLRINEGGYVSTQGLYIAMKNGSEGVVSVMGRASELHVYEGPDNGDPEGSGIFSASYFGFVQLHPGAIVKVREAEFSNGATLYLNNRELTDPTKPYNPITNPYIESNTQAQFDTMDGGFLMVNARIVGDGIIGGEGGVHIIQDDHYTKGQAYIDPGQVLGYDPHDKRENDNYYGTLVFGDYLQMTGNVITRFDISHENSDRIEVRRNDESTILDAPVTAHLSGTLQIHARCTDYYLDPDATFEVVHTYGEWDGGWNATGDTGIGNWMPGSIDSEYDNMVIVPWRFFSDIHQEIIQVEAKNLLGDSFDDPATGNKALNDVLVVSMTRNHTPFEDAGDYYNLAQVGKALDTIYALEDHDWLPILRHFWYLGDPDFANAMRDFSGEIRAHSLHLPMQNVSRYIRSRPNYQECTCERCVGADPCESVDGEKVHSGPLFFAEDDPCAANKDLTCAEERWKKLWRKVSKNGHVWGTAIFEREDADTDGNARGYDISRHGVVVGMDRLIKGHQIGFLFAYDEGKLRSAVSEAKVDDFQFGLYHDKKICNNHLEWKNYLGMGIQDYDMRRGLELHMIYMDPIYDETTGDPTGKYTWEPWEDTGIMQSKFMGYTFSYNTEVAWPLYFAGCKRNQIRPFVGLDVAVVWQDGATETGKIGLEGEEKFIRLVYHSAVDARVLGRYGVTFQREGKHGRGFLRGGLSHSYLLGGRPYIDVDNRFDYAGEKFNIRSVSEGFSSFNGTFGFGVYFGARKQGTLWADYSNYSRIRSSVQSVQVGAQMKF